MYEELTQQWEKSDLLNALRSDTGDIIVRLTPNPAEWLILDSTKLKEYSRVLISCLSSDYDVRPMWTAHPMTGVMKMMWTLSLIWDGETFVLTAYVSIDGASPNASPNLIRIY